MLAEDGYRNNSVISQVTTQLSQAEAARQTGGVPPGFCPRDVLTGEAERIKSVYGSRFKALESGGSARWRLYSCFDPAHLLLHHSRERVTLRLLDRYGLYPLTRRRILDVGCGAGLVLQEFLKYGALPENLHGVELLGDQVKRARKLNPALNIHCADAAELPFADESFDVVMQWTVFSSILDPRVRTAVAREMRRVLRPNGLILWYDFWPNNPANVNVRGVRAKEIRALFPGCQCHLRRAVLAPLIARPLARFSSLCCQLLERIPWLCSHYVGAIVRPPRDEGNSGIGPAQATDCDELARVHLDSFKGFYLASLGSAFLKELYRAFLLDPSVIALVARKEGRVVAFAVGLTWPHGFMARTLLRRGLPLLWSVLRHGLQLPTMLRRSSFSTGLALHGEATLFSLAVDPTLQHRGLGLQLVKAFLEVARIRGVARVVLTTDSENNEAVNRFYHRLGFRVRSQFITFEERKMNEFTFDLAADSEPASSPSRRPK